MSLVSEALKKAEREAAAREARGKGQPAPFEAPLQPYRSRRSGSRGRFLVPVLALFGAAAALTIALLLFRPTGQKEAPVNGTVTAAPEALPVPSAPPGTAPSPSPAPAPSTPTATTGISNPFARPEPEAPPLATHPLQKATQEPPPPSPSVSETPAPKPPAKVLANGSGDYLRSVEFKDGTKLELGGIVYSEALPFVYLNGRLVGIGEFVEGRRVDRIDRDKVILTGDDGTITLRLKAH